MRAAALLTAILLSVTVAVAVSGCGSAGSTGGANPTVTVTVTPGTATAPPATGPSTSGASGSPSPPATASGSTQLSVYFVRSSRIGVVHRWVPETPMVATAAVNQLLSGPTAGEKGSGVYSAIPAGTALRKLTISGTIATVDLSSAFAGGSAGPQNRGLRVAQVVFTATRFPTVKSVLITVDGAEPGGFAATGLDLGAPLRRADLEPFAPAILVESPAVNDTVGSPLKIVGTADVFEGTFVAQIELNDGTVLATKSVQASSGSGTRGAFAASIPFATREKKGRLVVFERSAKDGSPTHVVKVPLAFE
jgi:germination protein M